jgi:hypothetical protein
MGEQETRRGVLVCSAEKGPLSYNLGVSLKPGKQVPCLLDTARAPGRLSSRCAVMTIAGVAFVGIAAPCGKAREVVYDVFS